MAEFRPLPNFGSQDLPEPSPGKRPRKSTADRSPAVAPGGQPSPGTSPAALQQQLTPQWGPQPQQISLVAAREAGGSNEAALAAAAAAAAGTGRPGGEAVIPGGEAVTDAAKAFNELRVRPARGPSPHHAERVERPSGGAADRRSERPGERPERPSGGGERPASPKKRKATYNIDKEFILKDDKVKRNTDTQGDISQARGQLGQLLFEFSQIELNRDLLEAIKRTESKTGRSGGRPPAPGRLDRAAFELAVADAAELLQAQLSSVELHCADPALCAAILRSYAVQAIATFADEDSSSDEEDEGGANGTSSDDENTDRNSWRRQQRGGSSSQDGPGAALSGDTGSQSLDMLARPASAAACHSPPPDGLAQQQQQQQQQGQQQGRPLGGVNSPSRPLAAGSAVEQCSSSFLPDAPSDSALEDTATAAPRAAQRQQDGDGAPPATVAQQQQEQRRQAGAAGGLDEGGGMQQRMRMLSLEAEGSVQQGQQASGEDEDGPTDMIRSPAPVTSRRLLPLPEAAPAADLQRQESNNNSRRPGQQQGQGVGDAAGTRRTSPVAAGGIRMDAVLEEAGQLALDSRGAAAPRRGQRQSPQQPRQQPQQAVAAEQASSETTSGGQASSAAAEPPKRQRRSGDLLPPLQEHSSQHQRRAAELRRGSDPGALAAATAAQRAAILGSVQARPAGEPGAGAGSGAGRDLAPAGPQPAPVEKGPGTVAAAAGGEAAPADGLASDVALRQAPRAAHSGSSVWGSTLVCADLTVNDVASQYWPFLRSAMRGQAALLQEDDKALVASLVKGLGDTIVDTYQAAAHCGGRPAAEVRSLVAATAFDDFFRAKGAAESSGASL